MIDKGQRLLFDSGVDSGDQRILIFGIESNLNMLNTSSVWLADGTFTTEPELILPALCRSWVN